MNVIPERIIFVSRGITVHQNELQLEEMISSSNVNHNTKNR